MTTLIGYRCQGCGKTFRRDQHGTNARALGEAKRHICRYIISTDIEPVTT